MLEKKLVALVVIISITYGQTLAPKRGPPSLYAIYSDASIGNISLINSREEILQPSQRATIPLTCYDPLQCGIPPQQNGFSVIYIPSEGNSTLILLRLEGEILYTYNLTVPCIFSDFVLLQPDTEDLPLLIACELTSQTNNQIRYILSGPYGNDTRAGIEVVPLHPDDQALVSPIILEVYNDDEGQDVVSLVSINTQNEIVIFGAQNYELDTYPLGLDQSSCVPLCMQKLRSDIAFLLTCQGGHSYLVNISGIPDVSLVSLPSQVKALASNIKYSLTLTMDNSTATATIREVSTQLIAVRTIPQQLNAANVFGAGFGGPDDEFAYVATKREIIFIDVKMGLEGAEQFTHAVSNPVCSQCPPVTFLNNTTALVTSCGMPNNAVVHFYDLGSWPPLSTMNRTLSNQPRVYWYVDQYIQPTPSVATSVTSSISILTVSPTSSTDTRQDDGLSGEAIAGIVVGVICTILLGLIAAIIIIYFIRHKNESGKIRNPPNGIPDENAERMGQMVPGINLDPNVEAVPATS